MTTTTDAHTAHEESDSRAVVAFGENGLMPTDLEGAWRVAKMVIRSKLSPRGIDSPESVVIAMSMGREIGLSPMQSLRSIAVINGSPSVYGPVGRGILARAGCVIEDGWSGTPYQDDYAAWCKITRNGHTTERTFTVAQAKKAKLWGKSGPWTDYPDRMLQWRAFWWAAKDCASDLLCGLAPAEEQIDLPPDQYTVRDVTQPPPAEAAGSTDDDTEAAPTFGFPGASEEA